MDSLTILGGKGFVLGEYCSQFYHHAIGNIVSVNAREDYTVHSKDVLYGISTIHNFHIYDNPYIDIDTNLRTLVRVLENWRTRPDSKEGVFNFLSSWFVYSPKGFYSITKKCAEDLLVDYCRTFGLKYRILRLGNVLGNDPKISKEKNTLQYLINLLKQNEPVELWGEGNFHRDFIHVQDVVSAIDLVLRTGSTNEIFNIGNGTTWSYRDIILYAKEKLNSTSPILLTDGQVDDFSMDVSKIRGLGYSPKYFGEGLYEDVISHC